MPFGLPLTLATLPSGVQQAVALGRSWPYPAFAFVPVQTSPYLPLSPASEAANPASWIWRPSFERQRDFNPPEQRAAQRALPVCRPTGEQSVRSALRRCREVIVQARRRVSMCLFALVRLLG